jgi:AcrR family transcriptional regulator
MSRQIEEQAKGKHRETKGDKTKKELYTTALRLFREKGYENVSISEIAREAGTAKGTFYIHFPFKAAVVTEMLHYYDDTYEETAARLPYPCSPLTAIQNLIGESCRFTCETIGVDLIRVLYIQQLHKNPAEQGEMDYHRPLYQLFKHFFEQGQEQKIFCRKWTAHTMTIWLIRAIRGVFYEWTMENGNFDLRKETKDFTDALLQGFQK